nr:MAG TPA: helix-turn-helix domain protein [Caudoviricetes sp.]
MTQNERVLRHLMDGGTLTQAEAFQEYGIGRLSSRICELRKAGYPIAREFVTKKNRYGENVSFCRYWLGRGGDAE